MQECLSDTTIERFRRGSLDSIEELLAVNAHLDACTACRERLQAAALPQVQGLAQTLASGVSMTECPEGDQITRYVLGEADPTETRTIAAHVSACPSCALEVDDLRAFHAEMQSYDWGEVETVSRSRSPWARLRTWLTVPSASRMAFQITGAAALTILAGWIGYRSALGAMQTQVHDLRTQLSRMQASQDALTRQSDLVAKQLTRSQDDNMRLHRQLAQIQRDPGGGAVPAQIVVAVNDGGGRVALDSRGKLHSPTPLAPAVEQRTESALRSGQVKKPLLVASLSPDEQFKARGSAEGVSFSLSAPIATAVLSDRPQFRWEPCPGATTYVVHVEALSPNAKGKGIDSPQVQGTVWSPPRPLPRGRIYSWQVIAYKDGDVLVASPQPPAPEPKFKILDTEDAARVRRTRKTYARSHLAMGLSYLDEALMDDAEQEFEALRKANPDSQVARKLLQSVRRLRPGR